MSGVTSPNLSPVPCVVRSTPFTLPSLYFETTSSLLVAVVEEVWKEEEFWGFRGAGSGWTAVFDLERFILII